MLLNNDSYRKQNQHLFTLVFFSKFKFIQICICGRVVFLYFNGFVIVYTHRSCIKLLKCKLQNTVVTLSNVSCLKKLYIIFEQSLSSKLKFLFSAF